MAKKKERLDLVQSTRNFLAYAMRHKGLFFAVLLVALVIETGTVAERYIFKLVIDDGTSHAAGTLSSSDFAHALLLALGLYAGLLLVKTASKWLSIHFLNMLDGRIIAEIKRKFFDHIIDLDHKFHTTHKTGSLISRMSRGGRAVETMMDAVVFNFAAMVFQLSVTMLALLTIGWLPVLVIFLTSIVFVGYSLLIFRAQSEAGHVANATEDVERANLGDILANVDSVKYFGREEAVKRKFFDLTERTRLAFMRSWNYFRHSDAGQMVIIGIGTAALLAIPLLGLLRGDTTIGDAVFVYAAYTSVVGAMYGFVGGLRSYYRAAIDLESLYYYDRFRNGIEDAPGAKRLVVRRGAIAFNDITFSYHGSPLFEGLSLEIKAHEKVALVGRSGSGKSTLVKLLYRLYDVDGGEVCIDGKDIRSFRQESLRSELSIVPQECVLFDDTIYNNVAFSNPRASRTQVRAAMRFAQLDRLIKQLPKGEQTIVGERGVKLSGGEKQRVSIARAILADRKVLVLDEATSSLDSQTEHDIQRDLERLMRGRTAIIIAHRLSTIMRADRIVVLERGRVVQQGTHDELIAQQGVYRNLWELQRGGYIE